MPNPRTPGRPSIPASERREQRSIRLLPSTWGALEQASSERGVPLTRVIEDLIMTTTESQPAYTYTATGEVRGSCGHQHRTSAAAWRCVEVDRAGCKEQGGYSDRYTQRSDGAFVDEDGNT